MSLGLGTIKLHVDQGISLGTGHTKKMAVSGGAIIVREYV